MRHIIGDVKVFTHSYFSYIPHTHIPRKKLSLALGYAKSIDQIVSTGRVGV